MANSDVIVRIKADAKNYDANLAKATKTLDKFKSDNLSMGGVLSQSTTALTSMATKFLSVTAAVGAAMKVATDAFKQNELAMDEWGRSTEAAGAVYQGFLNALNTGDFGGFLRNIGNVITKAREAYDALDELGTFNAFNKIQVEGARTGFSEAVNNFRSGTGSKDDVKAAADRLKNELQTRQNKEKDAYIAAIEKLAASRGVDAEMLKTALSGTYGDYETLKNTPLTGRRQEIVGANQFSRGTIKVTEFAANEQERLGEMLRRLSDEELNNIQELGAQAQRTATEIEQIEKQKIKILSAKDGSNPTASKSTSSGYKLGNYRDVPEAGSLADLQQQAQVVQNSMGYATTAEEYKEMEEHLQTIIAKMNELKGVTAETFTPGSLNDLQQQLREAQDVLANMSPEAEGWAAALEKVRETMASIAAIQDQVNVKTDTGTKKANSTAQGWTAAANAVSEVGGALQQIEDPTAKVAGIIAQAVANIALSFAEAAASPAVTGTGWGWIGFAAAGIATMISTIASIKSVTGGFAQGGIIPGNSYSGDNLTANVNSGELILNRAQQDSLAGQLQNNPMNDLNLSMEVEGTKILILLNNTNRSLGGGRDFYTKRH